MKELAYLPRAMVARLSGAAVPRRGGERQARTRRRAPEWASPCRPPGGRGGRGEARRGGGRERPAGRAGGGQTRPQRCLTPQPPPRTCPLPAALLRAGARRLRAGALEGSASRGRGGAGRGGGLRAPGSRLRPRPGAEAGWAVGLLSLEYCH